MDRVKKFVVENLFRIVNFLTANQPGIQSNTGCISILVKILITFQVSWQFLHLLDDLSMGLY